MADHSPADTARALGISTETLRKHAREFAPLLSETAQGGRTARRRYQDTDILVLRRAGVLLATGATYKHVKQQLLGVVKASKDTEQPQIVNEADQDTGIPKERYSPPAGAVMVLDEQPEVEALRGMLTAQQTALVALQGTIEAQRDTLQAQGQLIAQLQQQSEQDRARSNQAIADALMVAERARADEAAALASLQTMLRKIPRWLRGLLGLGA